MKVEADLDAKGPEPEGRPISTFRTVGNSETTGLESIGDKSPYHSLMPVVGWFTLPKWANR